MAKNAKTRIKWNIKGFAELRNDPGVLADLDRRASAIAAEAGEGFEARPAQPGTKGSAPRGRASVGTSTYEGRRRQAKSNVLESAIWAGR